MFFFVFAALDEMMINVEDDTSSTSSTTPSLSDPTRDLQVKKPSLSDPTRDLQVKKTFSV